MLRKKQNLILMYNMQKMLKNNFTSNHEYNLCSTKGFKVVDGENGKLKIISQSRLIKPSFFS